MNIELTDKEVALLRSLTASHADSMWYYAVAGVTSDRELNPRELECKQKGDDAEALLIKLCGSKEAANSYMAETPNR